jgi:hypothetical protein
MSRELLAGRQSVGIPARAPGEHGLFHQIGRFLIRCHLMAFYLKGAWHSVYPLRIIDNVSPLRLPLGRVPVNLSPTSNCLNWYQLLLLCLCMDDARKCEGRTGLKFRARCLHKLLIIQRQDPIEREAISRWLLPSATIWPVPASQERRLELPRIRGARWFVTSNSLGTSG